MALYTLPPELKLNIAECLDPDSSLHLSLTCRDFHKLCQPILREHGRLFSEGQTIDTADSGIADTLVWSTLKKVLKDARKGWYVRELNLPASRWYHWDKHNLGLQPPNMLAVPPEEDQELFKKAARALTKFYPNTAEDRDGADRDRDEHDMNNFIATLEERISSGFDDAIIAILIHYLPNLRTIRITDVETDELERTIQRIAALYGKSSKTWGLPLQHLTTAAVAHWDSEMCCSADWACHFLSFPSLRTFAAHAMGDEPNFGLLDDVAPYSNATELFLVHCQFEVRGLEVILAGIKNLKKLTYQGGGCTVSESALYEPKRVITAIAKYVGHSLEELQLSQDDSIAEMSEESDLQSVSLRGFHKLKNLNCEWRMLSPLSEESELDEPLPEGFVSQDHEAITVFDVRDILPESLQELYLHGTFEDDEWENMTEILDSPSPATPNLEKMCIQRNARDLPYNNIAVFGDAPEPVTIDLQPLRRLLDGHGY